MNSKWKKSPRHNCTNWTNELYYELFIGGKYAGVMIAIREDNSCYVYYRKSNKDFFHTIVLDTDCSNYRSICCYAESLCGTGQTLRTAVKRAFLGIDPKRKILQNSPCYE